MKKTVRILLNPSAARLLPAGGYMGCASLSFRRPGDQALAQSGAVPQTGREYAVASRSDHDPVTMRSLLHEQLEPTPEDRSAARGRFALSPDPWGMGMGDSH